MARNFYRKLIDKQGNIYCVELPFDVDPDSIDSILLGIHDGIVKLQGYKLVGDVFRMPDNVEAPDGGKSCSFHKKLEVFSQDPAPSQEDFAEAIQELLERARGYRINRAKITQFEGRPVLEDTRGYYVKRQFACAAEHCTNKIEGTQRLSMRDGEISRAQMFEATDPKACRVRPGAKSWFCPSCAPTTIQLPEIEVVPLKISEPSPGEQNSPVEPLRDVTKGTGRVKEDEDLRELLTLSGPKSDVNPEFLKGMVYGLLKARLKH